MPHTTHATADVVIIGAGFAGLYALHRLRDEQGLSVRVFEAGDGVGGTWYWNRYPGARCDIESLEYAFTFSRELYESWTWSERYPTQPEIEAYANHVADQLDLRRSIDFDVRVEAATWDAKTARWTVTTADRQKVSCRFLIAATGCLSVAQAPRIPGLERFAGELHHTGDWPREGVDFAGKRAAVIGTGSSGVQAIPVIAEQAEHLTVFQRTPSFSLPAGQTALPPNAQADRARNLAAWHEDALRAHGATPVTRRTERSVLDDSVEQVHAELDGLWGVGGGFSMLGLYNDITKSEEANAIISEFLRAKIRATVEDPEVAEALCPVDHPFGSKRVILDTRYFETYNRDNVRLVSIKDNPIREVTPRGVLLEDGTEYELDVLVLATGFDAMTGALLRIDLRGRDGVTIQDAWRDGPSTLLGLQVAGFPNLFTVTGPGSPSVLASMMRAIEQHVDWISRCIAYMDACGVRTIEADEASQTAWTDHVREVASETVYMKAGSWFLGANVPGKPRVFMPYVGGFPAYKAACDRAAENDYEGFSLTRA